MKVRNIAYAIVMVAAAGALVLGTAGIAEAKGKKKAAAPPPPRPSPICLGTAYMPVCATRGGMKYTYANSCFAGNDGARVVSDKACPAPKAKKASKKGSKKAAKKKAKKKS